MQGCLTHMGIHHLVALKVLLFFIQATYDLFYFGPKIPTTMGIHNSVAVKVLFWAPNPKTLFFSSVFDKTREVFNKRLLLI